jgi:hypothetical protein
MPYSHISLIWEDDVPQDNLETTYPEQEPLKPPVAVFWCELLLGFGIEKAHFLKWDARLFHQIHDPLAMTGEF